MGATAGRGWLQRLRERGVIRVAASYAVIAWLLLQIADVTFEPMGAPKWAMPSLIVAAVLGFPIAVALAWFYEAGDRGVALDTAAEGVARPVIHGLRRYADLLIIGVLLATVAVLLVRQSNQNLSTSRDGSREPAESTVQLAVLPFQMAHPDPVSDYLALALPDAITTRLANLHTLRIRPTVTVLRAARNETDPQRLGRALSVDHVLTGVLHTTGDEMRVNLQLVRVNDGVPVWGESIQLPGGELLPFRDHPFVEDIINALQLQITAMERERLFSGRQPDAHAYQLHLVGRTALAQHTEQGMREAARSFQSAIDRDADFAAAHAGLARAAAEMTLRFATKPEVEEWHQRALAAAREALRLDPYSAEAHEAMTAIYRKTEFMWDLVLQHGLRALELNPSLEQPYFYIAGAYYHLGLFDDAVDVVARGIAANPAGDLVEGKRARGVAQLLSGRFDEARATFEEVRPQSDPRTIDHYLASAIYYSGDVEGALETLEDLSASSSASASSRARSTRAALLAQMGRRDEAMALALAVGGGADPRPPDGKQAVYMDHHVAQGLATAWAQLGRPDHALAWLEQAAATGFPCYPWFERDSLLDPVRSDPAVRAFLDAMKASHAEIVQSTPRLPRE